MERNVVCCIFVWDIIFPYFFFIVFFVRVFALSLFLRTNDGLFLMHDGMDDSTCYVMQKAWGFFYIPTLIWITRMDEIWDGC